MKVSFELPIPPSVNHYYGHCYNMQKKKVVVYIKPEGKLYRQKVYFLTANKVPKINNPLYTAKVVYVIIKFNPASPLRDIDNPFKCLFDAITHNHLWHDDRQVKKMYILTKEVFLNNDISLLPQIDELEEKVDAKRNEALNGHIDRLNAGLCDYNTVGVFVNIVANIERIGDHINFIPVEI